jgi:MerR family redox-sensitive transcriptional activator SoxR
MSFMSISQVARQIGIRPSAIRYYERIGILKPALRTSGQRRYDHTALYRLALIQRAQQTGFSLEEIRRLFFGFRDETPISQRWRRLSRSKLAELDAKVEEMLAMKALLIRISRCRCHAIEECGKAVFESYRRSRNGDTVP